MSQHPSPPVSLPPQIRSRISLTSHPGLIPSSLTFENTLQEGVGAYEIRTRENASKYLGSMTDYDTPDGFRRRIRATSTQLQRLNFLLIDRWVTFVTLVSVCFNANVYVSRCRRSLCFSLRRAYLCYLFHPTPRDIKVLLDIPDALHASQRATL